MTLNGYDYCVPHYVVQMENIVVAVAKGSVNKDLLQRVMVSLIEDDEFPNELKLDLVEAMGQGLLGGDADDVYPQSEKPR